MMGAVATAMLGLLICVVLAIVVSARFVDRKKQWPEKYCAKCLYDLRGLNVRSESGPTKGNGVCPERGTPTERKP